ncbi:MBL fold metallo-hydrolase [Congregibacter brevis]|uniref:MBL fold metallo-hydrolase n=1 Tax=Congregibacter brevis TaxID=3081201 RepID=A0ABZ0I8G2_9GAMM|nr:MBL fold metallo-hydrolase [Congregibacter sp. IMCC45268]
MTNLRVLFAPLAVLLASCSATDVPTDTADLGRSVSIDAVFEDIATTGPIEFEKVTAATWSVPLSGLLNLEHPNAQAAGIEDRDEAISVYTYVLKHPEHGVYLVDGGVSESFRGADNSDVSWLVAKVMNMAALTVQRSNREILAGLDGEAISGVLLTHIHLDHIMGFDDLPLGTDVYLGPGEAEASSANHLATRGTTNRLLSQVSQLREWAFDGSKALDVFGDGSLFAIHAPGHTAGLTVYLARTTAGAQLMIGDLTHTRWGWENGVEPGTYSADLPQSAKSLTWIKSLVDKYDAAGNIITVHPGHQSL